MELAGMIQIQLSKQHLRLDMQHTVLVFQVLFPRVHPVTPLLSMGIDH